MPIQKSIYFAIEFTFSLCKCTRSFARSDTMTRKSWAVGMCNATLS